MVLDTPDDVVAQWLATWQRIRDVEIGSVDGWPLVHVAGPSRETELVCFEPDVDELPSLAGYVAGDPRAMLTVASSDVGRYLTVPLPPDVSLERDDESLMTTRLHDHPVPALPDGLTFRWEVDDRRTTYSLEAGEELAAVGTVGVLDGVATFDRIETMPAFQRRGLGRHVMTALTVQAMGRGATHGVLAASAAGRSLYLTLGWETRLELLSWMGR